MTTYNMKSITPKTTMPSTGVVYGADDQSTTSPAPYTLAALRIFLAGAISGLLKLDGSGGFSAASAGTDYVAPAGALGTPSSGTLTNCTGLPGSGLTSGVLGSGVGFTATPFNLGSASAWTASITTLSISNGNMQFCVNDHACTMSVQGTTGSIQFDISNTTGAGAITFSGWDLIVGPAVDTTTTSKFSCVSKVNQNKVLQILKVA